MKNNFFKLRVLHLGGKEKQTFAKTCLDQKSLCISCLSLSQNSDVFIRSKMSESTRSSAFRDYFFDDPQGDSNAEIKCYFSELTVLFLMNDYFSFLSKVIT